MRDNVLDFGGYPEIHSSGVGDVQFSPDGRIRWVHFGWYLHDGIWRRRIVGTVSQPVNTIPELHLAHWAKHYGGGDMPRHSDAPVH